MLDDHGGRHPVAGQKEAAGVIAGFVTEQAHFKHKQNHAQQHDEHRVLAIPVVGPEH